MDSSENTRCVAILFRKVQKTILSRKMVFDPNPPPQNGQKESPKLSHPCRYSLPPGLIFKLVLSFNYGCVIAYWSKRGKENSDEEKSVTEEWSGTRSRSTVQLLPIWPLNQLLPPPAAICCLPALPSQHALSRLLTNQPFL